MSTKKNTFMLYRGGNFLYNKTLNHNNFINIGAKDVNYISFKSTQWDKSNGAKIIKIQSTDTKIVIYK